MADPLAGRSLIGIPGWSRPVAASSLPGKLLADS